MSEPGNEDTEPSLHRPEHIAVLKMRHLQQTWPPHKCTEARSEIYNVASSLDHALAEVVVVVVLVQTPHRAASKRTGR